jgi:hypothetical protein
MKRYARTWAGLAFLLAAGLSLLAASRGRGDPDEDAKKKAAVIAAGPDVLKLADALNGDTEAAKKQADVVAALDLPAVMGQLGLRERGGQGIGPKPGAVKPDGIEMKLNNLADSTKPLKDKQLAAEKADLQRALEITRAVAEVTPRYAAKYAKNMAEEKLWAKYSDEMKKTTQEMLDALMAGDPKKVQRAAGNVSGNCFDCHTKFRKD